MLERNAVLMAVLERATTLDLPDCYVVAGAVYQTVRNVRTGRPPAEGIKDYDLAYHDAGDLSHDAEDDVIGRARTLYAAFGTTDLLSMTVRPNIRLATRDVYERKVASWTARWPDLTVLPWPARLTD